MAFSAYWADGFAKAVLGLTGAPAVDGAVWLACFTTMPASDGTGGVELDTADGFTVARLDVAGDDNWTMDDDGTGLATQAIDWSLGTPTADPGDILGCALYDADTDGHSWTRPVVFDVPIPVVVGVETVIPAGSVMFRGLPSGA